ncbi:MAG TPA: hypothetical protein G4N92_00035 [Anaerolineae bacterium]|nr:hypothetical protein [Anaerolineae bacterium]
MTDLPTLSKNRLIKYRKETFHSIESLRIHTRLDAVNFVNERGFAFFWPIKGIDLPSLWVATAGERSVPDFHDDPGHITWRWKDELLNQRKLFYAKILRKKSTFISLELAPYFYALSPNYGDSDNDYIFQYKQGLMTIEARTIYETLLQNGSMHTLELREKSNLTSKENKYRFEQALVELQAEMKILPVGIAHAGRWKYAMIYDIVPRHFPELPERAREISEKDARLRLSSTYLISVGASQIENIMKLFNWRKEIVGQIVDLLVAQGLVTKAAIEEKQGKWFALNALLN